MVARRPLRARRLLRRLRAVARFSPGLPRGGGAGGEPDPSDLAFASIPWRAAVRRRDRQRPLPLLEPLRPRGKPVAGGGPRGDLPSFRRGRGSFFRCRCPRLFRVRSRCFWVFSPRICSSATLADLWSSAALTARRRGDCLTYPVFWNGWSVGPSTATFPLLLLGLRRIARRGRHGVPLTVAALLLSLAGGHPESFFHATAAAGVFLVELRHAAIGRVPPPPRRARRGRACIPLRRAAALSPSRGDSPHGGVLTRWRRSTLVQVSVRRAARIGPPASAGPTSVR